MTGRRITVRLPSLCQTVCPGLGKQGWTVDPSEKIWSKPTLLSTLHDYPSDPVRLDQRTIGVRRDPRSPPPTRESRGWYFHPQGTGDTSVGPQELGGFLNIKIPFVHWNSSPGETQSQGNENFTPSTITTGGRGWVGLVESRKTEYSTPRFVFFFFNF